MHNNPFDIQSLTKAFESLSGLTGLNYSVYGDRKKLLMFPTRQDALLTAMKTHKNGQKLYNDFIDKHFEFDIMRKEPYTIQGPTGQYHLFIPVRCGKITLVVLAEAFYTSSKDFKEFYMNRGVEFGLKEKNLEAWLKEILIIPRERMEDSIQNIHSLIENLIVNNCEKVTLNKRWQWSNIMISLLTSIKSNVLIKDVYQMITDAAIFLFDVDTVTIFSLKNGSYCPEVSSGRNKNVIQKLSFSEDNEFILEATISEIPVIMMDSHELWQAGFPEEIISMYLFPIPYNLEFFGFLGIFNSLLDEEAIDLLSKFCRLSGHVCSAIHLSEEHRKKVNEFNQIRLMALRLFTRFKNPEQLYDSIIDEAASLADAEKCSLMLPEKDVLRVNACRGINKSLMESVRVRRGEGIAGEVYEQGIPILIDHEKTLRNYVISPRPLYKTSSCLSLPLKIVDEVIGILNLSDKHSGEPFSESDLFVFNMFALQASIFLKLCSFYRNSEEMKKLSMIDPLTGIFNRRYFDIRLKEEMQRASRHKLSVSLAIIDVDDFKLFNDTAGHLAGDRILKEIALIISGTIRNNDTLIRFGGDEFALIIPQTSNIETSLIAERIRQKITTQVISACKEYPRKHITVSIGMATYPDCGEHIETLIRCADKALYRAKMQGKDRTVFFE
jgi:diguanylate cyclase (GGDEF)-like protein